jgi:Amt family ammonium transporter
MQTVGARLRTNWKDPLIRRHIGYLFLGKAIGLGIVLTLITRWFLPAMLGAQAATPAPALDPMAAVNAINTVWTLVAAFLVFGMQVGFVLLEAGFARSRESVNILVEGIADTCICGVTFWLWGFAFMFEPGNGFIGLHGFALQGLPATYGTTGVALLAFWVFQFAFADTCSTITSGAMIGRCGFVGDLLYSVGVTGFIYPIIGHWAWGPDGWLATMGPIAFHDFAGSTVVHTIGGAISLAGAIALGPRLGRVFKRDDAGARSHHRRGGWPDPVVRMVWLQPRQHALRTRHPGNWAGVLQHYARCVLGRTHRSVLLVHTHEEVGPRAVDQRIPRWPGGDHLSLLLG